MVWTRKQSRGRVRSYKLVRPKSNEPDESDEPAEPDAESGDLMEPNEVGLTQTYCDPHFFDPDGHAAHMENMDVTDVVYIKHMIPHHQVAVDMSKVLLANTSNDYMIYMAHRIIRSQQEEIALLHSLLAEHNYNMESELLA